MKHLVWILLFLLCATGYHHVDAQDTTEVRFMRHSDRQPADEKYFFDLLEIALQNTEDNFGPYKITFTDKGYTQQAGLAALREGDSFEVLYTMTSKAREMVLRPVRIPLMKGLAGHRINVIKKRDEALFSNVYLQADLKDFTFIQGKGWPDTEILRASGLKVVGADENESFYKLLAGPGLHAFPRAASEISREQDQISKYNLVIDEHIVLYYPTAFYFFVNKGESRLAERIETGLNKAIKDGAFNTLFNTYYKQSIQQLTLSDRRYIILQNPLLPDKTPVIREELWLDRKLQN